MAVVWQVRERRRQGGSDKVWTLGKEGEGLSVGRATYCDVQVLSQSIEKKHAVVRWDQKKEAYEVRDLGSVNGTFLNDIPLSNGVGTLHHGDTLRFGSDKGHLFHVQRVECPSPISLSSPAPSHLPTSAHTSPAPSHLPTSTHISPAPSSSNSPTPSQVPGVQYVSIPSVSPSVIFPSVQPYILPQPIYSPHIQQVGHMTGHVTTSAPYSVGGLSPFVSTSPVPTTSLHLVQYTSIPPHSPLTTSTLSPGTPDTLPANVSVSPGQPATSSTQPRPERYEPESAGIGKTCRSRVVSPRKDGRRSISLSSADMPLLSEVSSLYGAPSWWGEKERETASTRDGENTARRLRRSVPQILRDISPPRNPPFDAESNFAGKVSTHTGEAEKSSSQHKMAHRRPKASWTVETGPRRSRALPPKLRRHVRSADSSPVRRPDSDRQAGLSGVTPVRVAKGTTATSSKDFTPLSQRVTASKPPSGSRKAGRKSSSPVASAAEASLSGVKGRQKEKSSRPERPKVIDAQVPTSSGKTSGDVSSDTVSSRESNSTSLPVLQLHATPTSGGDSLRSQSETGMTGVDRDTADETFVVTSPIKDERASSARKQWSHEPQQPQHSLMMASIEARMRRLNKFAQNTYLSLSAMEQSRVSQSSHAVSCPSPIDTESQLPEWKFFDKEVDSIFKNIRSVEKWLKDIDATVAKLQVQEDKGEENEERGREVWRERGRQDDGGGGGNGNESVDYAENPACSGDEVFHDSIEELHTPSSD